MDSISKKNVQKLSSEAGTGSGEVLAYILCFIVVWGIFYWVTDWIYNTKEDKVDRRYSRAEERYRSSQEKKNITREVGGSEALCTGFLFKTCKSIQ